MASMGTVLRSHLARQMEAKLRYEGSILRGGLGWQSMTVKALADWIYGQRISGSPFTYIQYYNLANSVIRNSRDAATMMANPSMTILNLGVSPGIPQTYPKFEYRGVVAGKDASGKEVWSTLAYVYSDTELNATQVINDMHQQVVSPLTPPGYPQYPEGLPGGAVSIGVYIVSAGRRS